MRNDFNNNFQPAMQKESEFTLLGPLERGVSRRRCALLILMALMLLGVMPTQAAGLLADPDRTRLGINETLTLRLIADGRLKGEPELSPLEKDFEILGRSTSSRTTILNGEMSQSREWVLELAPRHTGALLIPALTLGGERSQPVTVQVVSADQTVPNGGPRPLFLDTQADNLSPYVQEPFTYRVKVYYRDPPRQATLGDPQVDGATIEQRGEDQSYTELVDGLRYTVLERRYLVTPQRSGPLRIGAPRLEAMVSDPRSGVRRSPFADLDEMLGGRVFQGMPGWADLGGGRRVVERGPERTLEVRPQPAGSAEPWLPAQSIQLTDQWNPSPPKPRVGEPITRSLTITAQGVSASQLPTLDPGQPEGARVYPEPPALEDLAGAGTPAATKTLKLALVPTQAGTLTLPEIRLRWWDTVEDRERVAVIPQRILDVAPAAAEAPATPESELGPALSQASEARRARAALPVPKRRVDAGSGGADSAPGEASGPAMPRPRPEVGAGFWPWLSLALGLGWLLTLTGWFWRHRQGRVGRRSREAKAAGLQRGSERSARAALRSACTGNDPRSAREALIGWGQARWPAHPPVGLAALAERLGGGEATAVFQAIDRAIYAPDEAAEGAPWDGALAWSRLEPLLKAASARHGSQAREALPPLYPQGI